MGEVCNVGGHSERPNIFIVKKIIEILHDKVDPSIDESLIKYVEDRMGHDRRYGIDPEKIKNELAGTPRRRSRWESKRPSTGIWSTRTG